MPNISICIPAYHAATFLPETLASIAAQTYGDWELIVVEDGSDDGTRLIVAKFSETVPQKVTYLRHDVNRGLSETRNTAFRTAQGDWFALIDADDVWATDHLMGLVEQQRASGADFVWSTSRVFDSDTGKTMYLREAPRGEIERIGEKLFRGELVIQPSAVLFRNSIVTEIGGFDPSFPICNDQDYWLRAAEAGVRFAGVSNATCHYRKHADAMSNKSAELIAESGRVKSQFRRWNELPRGLRIKVPAVELFHAARMSRRSHPISAICLLFEAVTFLIQSTACVVCGNPTRKFCF